MEGYFSLVLHAHLPYVRHPEYKEFLEEDWLYEAITETYIPFLMMFERLHRDNVEFNITLTMSGTLANMLKDDLLMSRYLRHMDKMVELCEKELDRLKDQPAFLKVARHNYDTYRNARQYFLDCNRDLVSKFRYFQDLGHLEIIPVTATHGMLPMMKDYDKVANAQVLQAKIDYMEHFGREPKGIWLAECAYYPG